MNLYQVYYEKQQELKALEVELKDLKEAIIKQMEQEEISEYIDKEISMKFSYKHITQERQVIDKEFIENDLPEKYKKKLYTKQIVKSTTLYVKPVGAKNE